MPSPAPHPLLDPDVLGELYPYLGELRVTDPVHWCEPLRGWVLTRHDDVQAALRDRRFSSDRVARIVRAQVGEENAHLARDFERIGGRMMVMKDGPDHHRLRVLGNRGFVPSFLDHLRPTIQGVVDDLLDRLEGRERFDVVDDLSSPLPSRMIAKLFGIPPEDQEKFQRWSDDVARFFGGTLGDRLADARAANEGDRQLETYFLTLLARRRERPGPDLASLLLAGQDEGRVTAEEVCSQCILILIAGHTTTIDQLANLVFALLAHPDQLDRVRREPGLIASAVEEGLRYDTSVPFVHRVVGEDLDLHGRRLRRGDGVLLGLAAANRDPAAFADPDRFDVGRGLNDHVSFAGGPHVCLGAGLARRELAIALETLLRRRPGLRLDPERAPQRRCASLMFRGFEHFSVCG
jgi:cytochrome P450